MRRRLIAFRVSIVRMAKREHFEYGEWYHCYNRGIDKRDVFDNELDAARFLMTLYLANGSKPIRLFSERKPTLTNSLDVERGSPLVAIGAYCLMPNHFHLLIKEETEGGISKFMSKLSTAYTMYYNAKNDRVGNLFLKSFRSRHISNDRYLQRVLQYIHCNPAELYESGWKQGRVRSMGSLQKKLLNYPYSSLSEYENKVRTSDLLSQEVFAVGNHPPLSRLLEDAREYYADKARGWLER